MTSPWAGDHVGRHFTGTRLEAVCPCPTAPCGLVYADRIRSDCPDHAHARSMRQSHVVRNCPGGTT
ncbi:hypothetical protein OIE75_41075 (plasmid) [Streptomyces sp. NBC_01723]|uniref:hypothetical protein n=1 Tax=Streptomyces sp. NBC_01723 TaxID=2975921 RepID=UPI002E3436A1|nr:hypothetical protein [Streptomyces sp. NBC_01723]